MANEPTRLAIPRLIWDSLEMALKGESRRLVKDIAKTLGQDETELWKEVSKTTLSVYLADLTEPTDETYTCQAYNLTAQVQKICKKPVIFGHRVCPEHVNSLGKKPSAALPMYRRLQYYDEDDSVEKECYLNPATNELIDKETLLKIGIWNTHTQTALIDSIA